MFFQARDTVCLRRGGIEVELLCERIARANVNR